MPANTPVQRVILLLHPLNPESAGYTATRMTRLQNISRCPVGRLNITPTLGRGSFHQHGRRFKPPI